MNTKNIDLFITEHEDKDYCEAIINKNGDIFYASPSHTECLIEYSGKSREIIYNLLDDDKTVIQQLVELTGVISIWSTGYMLPYKPTDNQIVSLHKLIQNGLTSNIKFNK